MRTLLAILICFSCISARAIDPGDSKYKEARIGVGVNDIPEGRELELDNGTLRFRSKGVMVNTVLEGGPASVAGIKQFDLIERLGDERVTTIAEYQAALRSLTPAEEIVVRHRQLEWKVVRGETFGSYSKRSLKTKVVPWTLKQEIYAHFGQSYQPESGDTRWLHRDYPGMSGSTGFDVWLAVDQKSSKVKPYFNFRYRGKDWLFWTTAYVVVNGESFRFENGYFDPTRKMYGANDLSEWTNTYAEDPKLDGVGTKLMKSLENANSITLILTGKSYKVEHALDKSEVSRILHEVTLARLKGWSP